MEKLSFIEKIKGASKEISCDIVIKNISIIDVFGQESYISDVAIKNGYIVGIGDYECKNIIDGTGKYICPSLMDAHAHIESSLTTPNEYSKVALLHGVTSLIADPHEIGNVLGIEGIKLLMDLSKNIPFDFYFMLPSCVPATPFENSGAILDNEALKSLYDDKMVLGLGEVMDCPAVTNGNDDMISKLLSIIEKDKIIDGHGAGLTLDNINAYCTANIRTDHECNNPQEAIEKLRRGMYIFLREGTVAKNLKDLISIVSVKNSRRLCFCTDDKHIDDLIKTGTIDSSIRTAIDLGVDPYLAIQMATLNVAECYNLKNKGAIAPGYIADFIILNDLKTFKIHEVYKRGKLVVSNGKFVSDEAPRKFTSEIRNTITLPKLDQSSFKIDLNNKSILNAIELTPNKLETKHLKFNISELNLKGEFESSLEKDLIKIAVIERHKNTGNIGLGILKGIGLKNGAIATTIAHDSHNLIVCGTNDDDMIIASNKLKEIGGGIIITSNGKVLASIKLEIAGLITARPPKDLLDDLERLHIALDEVAPNINFNPFLTLSFLSLPVIPDIKITDKGLFNVLNFEFISVTE
ncbi:adenine deaminase [Clostridium sp. SHJSY1]|uniref:adenine deaminase n=1 Tax=Clostridium sp. SHJSY1 TaxID=2942483 RepID=UPI002875985E|nr:adenine deaminase [Clostridium sp. SHJSY1]MDS0528163.1 adenine deaminase [Clostridium sp. SHJSY1]